MKTPSRLILCLLLLFACKKSSDQIPNVRVDFYIYLNQPSYAALNAVGNYVYMTGGVNGLIVYHKTIDEFSAYDRACPYDYSASGARIEIDTTGIAAIDRHCGSKFNILDGSVTSGPATRPMKGYAADYDGSTSVHVHN